jgi:hypothetical protein
MKIKRPAAIVYNIKKKNMMAYWGSMVITPLILNLGIRLVRMISRRHGRFASGKIAPTYLQNRRQSETQQTVCTLWKREKSGTPMGGEAYFFGCSVHSLVTTSSTLNRIKKRKIRTSQNFEI